MYSLETRRDNYTNLKLLGRGTNGVITTKVRDLIDQKLYVVKNLGNQKLSENQKEILKILEKNECEFIVKHYYNEYNEDEIKTEFIENGDLQDYMITFMDLEHPIEKKILWKIFLQCLGSIKYLHGKNIIHRNIRLENFYLTDDMDIKLGNFRYATFKNKMDEDMYYPEDGMFYKNDDALNNNIYNEYSDLYALGVVFYLLCFHEFPFDIIERKGKYELKRNPKKNSNYSDDIKDFINKLLTEQKPDIEKLYDEAVHKFIETNVTENLIESSLRCFSSFGGIIHNLCDEDAHNPTYLYKDDASLIETSYIVQACIYFQYKEEIGNKIVDNYKKYINKIKDLFMKNYRIKDGQGPKIIDVIQFLFETYKKEVRKKFSNSNDKKAIEIISFCKNLNGTMEISNISSILKELKFKYEKFPRYLAIPLIQCQEEPKKNYLDKETNKNYIIAGYVIKKIINGKEKYIPIYQKKIKNKDKGSKTYDYEYRKSLEENEQNKIQIIGKENIFDNSEGTIEILFYKEDIPMYKNN